MSLAVISLGALILALALSSVSTVNVGFLADRTPYIKMAGLDGQDSIERWEQRRLTDAENTQLREMFEYDIKRVTVAPAAKVGSKLFDPSRVAVTWR